jgi:radical SAM protein with 4Fe4S-binding SPASM domain
MFNSLKLTDRLFDAVARAILWIAPRLRSRTGSSNPRVRHITALGYAIRAYRTLTPNIRAWLSDRAEIFPAIVQVQTVNRCNAACKMCPYPYTVHREPYQLMSGALWEKIARECASEPTLQVLVPMSKNEPLLDPHLDDRMAFFRRHAQPHQELELVTNGARLDAARLDRLAASGLDMITISVSAATPETYERTMAGMNWERLMRNLDSLQQAAASHVNIFVRCIRQRDNYREVRAFRRRWLRAGFNVLVYEVNNRSGTLREYAKLREPASLSTGLRGLTRRWLSRRIFPVCPHAFSIAHVLANGDLPLCANDWHNREVLGNAHDQTIRAIYNSPRAQAIRELMRQGRYDEIAPCKDCSLWKEANWL